MQISKVPFEYGWDWFFSAWHATKELKKPFLYVGAVFFLASQGAKLIPFFGLLISSFIYCYLFLSLFDYYFHWSSNKAYDQINFIKFVLNKSMLKEMLPLAYFKMAASTFAQLSFLLAEYSSRFMLIGLVGFAVEFVSCLYVLHLAPLMFYKKLPLKEALLLTTKSIRTNFLAEVLFFAWAIIIGLSSTLSFFIGWYFSAPMFGYAFYLKHISIYGEIGQQPTVEIEAINFQKVSGN